MTSGSSGGNGNDHRPTPVTGHEIMAVQADARERRRKTRSGRKPGNGPVPHDDAEVVAALFPAPPAEAGDEIRYRDRVRVLGHDGDVLYFMNASGQVQPIRSRDIAKSTSLYLLAERAWWLGEVAVRSDDGKGPARIPLDAVAGELMHLCHQAGLFRPGRVRGRGIWWDERRGPIVHLGDTIVAKGRRVHPSRFRSGRAYVFEARPRLDVGIEAPLPVERAALVLDALRLVNWREPVSARLVAGWIVCAIASGALAWRPHVWIIGQPASGKSWVVSEIIMALIGHIAAGAQSAATTQAGLRQEQGPDARPIVIDEADPGVGQRSRERQEGVMELLRAAASGTDLPVLQGTQNHTGVRYAVQSAGLIASVSAPIRHAADQSRFVVMEMRAAEGDGFAALESAVRPLHAKGFADGLFWRVVANVRRLRDDAALLTEALIAKVSNRRAADVYGHLLAGSLVLERDGAIAGPDAAREIVARWIEEASAGVPEGLRSARIASWLGAGADDGVTSEETMLLAAIAGLPITVEPDSTAPGSRTTNHRAFELIRDLVEDRGYAADKERALSRIGLRVIRDEANAPHLAVANVCAPLDKLLEGSAFGDANSRRQVLRRITGAFSGKNPNRFATGVSKYVAVPFVAIDSADGVPPEEEALPY
jgi:putative DNA primase/helicase